MKKVILIILVLISNICLCQSGDGLRLLNTMIDKYSYLNEISYDHQSNDPCGYIIKFSNIDNQRINVSISSVVYYDEVIGNYNSAYFYHDKIYYLQYKDNDSLFCGVNLKLLGSSNKSYTDSISRAFLSDSKTGCVYIVYSPFLTLFEISKSRNFYKIYYVIYYPEISCPAVHRIKRNYDPAGKKFICRPENLNSRFKRLIGKKKRFQYLRP